MSQLQSQRRRDYEMLVISMFVLTGSLVLEVSQDRVQTWGAFQLPGLCLSREMFGVSCPGCGLTRSFIHLAHGRFATAFETHHVGPVLAFFALIQIPYRLISLYRWPRQWPSLAARTWIGNSLIFALIANWVIKTTLQN